MKNWTKRWSAQNGMSKETEKALQNLSRHQSLRKLMADVLCDINVCRLEGWDWKEYPLMIKNFIDGVLNGRNKKFD